MTGEKSTLTNSVFETLAFFDAQDLALTAMEIKNYLGEQAALLEIEDCLSGDLRERVAGQHGLYFLRGRESLIKLRRSRYRTTLVRFHKTKKYLKFLCHVPYLRAVAISGSQALLNSTAASDIDLLVVTRPNRIWLARTLVSVYFHLLGQRRHHEKVSNRFCLNHYLVADREITEDRNLYTAVEYASLLPVLGEGAMQQFWQKNLWVKEFLPQMEPEKHGVFFAFRFSIWQKILELILDFTLAAPLNYFLGLYQKSRVRRQEYILVSDEELSFHPGSRGQRILSLYKQRIL